MCVSSSKYLQIQNLLEKKKKGSIQIKGLSNSSKKKIEEQVIEGLLRRDGRPWVIYCKGIWLLSCYLVVPDHANMSFFFSFTFLIKYASNYWNTARSHSSGESEGIPCQNPVLMKYVVALLKSSKTQVWISSPRLGNWKNTVVY